MKQFKIVPLNTDIATEIKATMKDKHGHSLEYSTPEKRMNPCRLCLGDTDPGQLHVLFSYMPFVNNKNPFAEVGPVYVHQDCSAYLDVNVFPPDIKKRKYLQVRGYDADDILIKADLTEGNNIESMIEEFLNIDDVMYLHIRHGQTGCYLLKVERA